MRKFIKNNEQFICINCHKDVLEHKTSSRDHCNYCLYSIHIDINPGDRQNKCLGILLPIGIETSNGKVKIVYRCDKCGVVHKCIKAEDDDPNILLELSTRPLKL